MKPKYNISPTAGSSLGVKHNKIVVLKNKLRNSGFSNGNCKLDEKCFKEIVRKRSTKTVLELSKEYNVHRTTISRLLTRQNIKTKKIYNQKAKEKLKKVGSVNLPKHNRPVVQYNKQGDTIAKFDSLTEAANKSGADITTIWASCKNITGNYKNRRYYFRYLSLEA